MNPNRDGNVDRSGSVKSTDSNDSIGYTINNDSENRVCYETKIIGGIPVRTIKVLP